MSPKMGNNDIRYHSTRSVTRLADFNVPEVEVHSSLQGLLHFAITKEIRCLANVDR